MTTGWKLVMPRQWLAAPNTNLPQSRINASGRRSSSHGANASGSIPKVSQGGCDRRKRHGLAMGINP